MKDKFVINIGRQLGSGGKAVGEAVAARLGIGVYDKQLINLAAEQSGICPEIFEKADEKESRNLFATFIGYLRSPFVGSEYSGSNVLSSDALFKIQSDVIRDLASRESCVFVGRCADYALAGRPGLLRIFCRADLGQRIRRIEQRHNLSKKKAALLVAKTDRHRRVYYHHHTGQFWGHSSCYDLTVNTGVLGVEKTAETMEAFIRTFWEQD